ncbi:GNAT family N-acetyltransferase [Paenibacillus athensensis]|nr:GNAT family N-acetyltransferase [Paenibacillus athensensis]MCD1260932.1 GNAT family N-acetyltransferase [Paenibacillus athensensis]
MLRFVPAASDDELFLYELYADTRKEELSVLGWDNAQQDAFLRMQFHAQQRSYRTQYAGLEQRIIYQDDQRIGQISTAVTEQALLVVDLVFLPEYRNQGHGTSLLAEVQETARQQSKPVRLHVLHNNPAQRLYARMGFRITGGQFPYVSMEWNES